MADADFRKTEAAVCDGRSDATPESEISQDTRQTLLTRRLSEVWSVRRR